MRLIDADAITEDERQEHGFFYNSDLQELLDEQPTIDISNTSHTLGALDCVSREDLIKGIEAYFDDLPIAVHYDMLALAQKLPSVQPEWIPCSERLPDEGTEVLGTDDHGCIRHVVKDKCGLYEFATYEEMMHINIVAWQPLPEPYKEEKQ